MEPTQAVSVSLVLGLWDFHMWRPVPEKHNQLLTEQSAALLMFVTAVYTEPPLISCFCKWLHTGKHTSGWQECAGCGSSGLWPCVIFNPMGTHQESHFTLAPRKECVSMRCGLWVTSRQLWNWRSPTKYPSLPRPPSLGRY